MVLVNNLMWYVPAGVLETLWLIVCGVLSYRLVKSLEICDKDLNKHVWVRSEFTDFEGRVRVDDR